MWNVRAKVTPLNNSGDWNHFKITQTIPEQHTRTAQNEGNANNSHMRHCAHTTESTNVNVQNIFHMRNKITCSTNCKYRTAAKVCTQETWFVSGI